MTVFTQISSNKRKTILILLLFMLLIIAVAWAISYLFNANFFIVLAVALSVGVIYAFISIKYATSFTMSRNHAIKVENRNEYLDLISAVENVALIAKLPVPEIYIIQSSALNAFATGMSPQNAAVAVTKGLVDTLERDELEAVIAHEIAHIKGYDVRLATVAIIVVTLLSFIPDMLRPMMWSNHSHQKKENKDSHPIMMLLAIVIIIASPIIATFLQLALSRQREFLADAQAVYITRHPQALIRALEKVKYNSNINDINEHDANIYFNTPMKHLSSFMNTHPSIDDRITALKNM